ncbi:MAG: CYTH domain-containing protein [Halodesulfurarchaeum sp.]|nr:CYTH domain-containing protein [Halodesulfurarchaeum sp.]
MERVLAVLGFEPAATVEKTRTRYDLDGVTVVLDRVEGLGEFVEVETTATDETVEQAQKTVANVLEGLGLDPETQISTSYLELLASQSTER